MLLNDYIGHNGQIAGVDEFRLQGGKGDGMRMLCVRNASGLEFLVNADRCADIPRLSVKGVNIGLFSPCGFVGPEFYDKISPDGFLGSFTAGFLTTCGLSTVGAACTDSGEFLPMHGTIGNTPCDNIFWTMDSSDITIRATVRDCRLFSRKLVLTRTIKCKLDGNSLSIRDSVENEGTTREPLMLLYHMNLAYPLLTEKARVSIDSVSVTPRDERAAQGIDSWDKMLPPTEGFTEQCYYHRFDKSEGFHARVYNPDLNLGFGLSCDPTGLSCLTQWKMNGVHEYVLGLEPGNCTVDGRAAERDRGTLMYIGPGECRNFDMDINFFSK
ncbi:MAG: aldose 1-epimerase family protein [Bacteroidales bacterium]|nr:aldose 1-epimerase family protein [Bacteroidales bacterium]